MSEDEAFEKWFEEYQAEGSSTVNDSSRIDMQAAFQAGAAYARNPEPLRCRGCGAVLDQCQTPYACAMRAR